MSTKGTDRRIALIFVGLILLTGAIIHTARKVPAQNARFLWVTSEPYSAHAISGDGSIIASCKDSGELALRYAETGKHIRYFSLPEYPTLAAIHPSNEWLASVHRSPWAADAEKESVVAISSLADGKLLVSTAIPVEVSSTLAGGFVFARGEQLRKKARQISFSPDGELLAIAIDDGVFLWKFPDMELVRFLVVRECSTFAFSPSGESILIGGFATHPNRYIYEFSTDELRPFAWKTGLASGSISIIRFSRDGGLAAMVIPDDGIYLWNIESRALEATIQMPNVRAISFSPEGKSLAIAHSNRRSSGETMSVELWSLADRPRILARFIDAGRDIRDVLFVNEHLLVAKYGGIGVLLLE